MTKYYVPVETIEKQIAFMKELQDVCREKAIPEAGMQIEYAIKMLRLMNSHANRVSDDEIWMSKQDEAYHDTASDLIWDKVCDDFEDEDVDVLDKAESLWNVERVVENFHHNRKWSSDLDWCWRTAIEDATPDEYFDMLDELNTEEA